MKNISEHISYKEATYSQAAERNGIDNTPSEDSLSNMRALAKNVFEPIRNKYRFPIYISSFYRSKELNDFIGGSKHSQHLAVDGSAAIDIDFDIYGGVSNLEAFKWIKDNIKFDQLIAENVDKDGNIGWIHISYRSDGKNRGEVLKMIRYKDENGKVITKYEDWE